MTYFSFGQSTADKVEQVSRTKIRPVNKYVFGGGCMGAVYKTLSVLLGDRYAVKGAFGREFRAAVRKGTYSRNNVANLFSALTADGMAHPMGKYGPNRRGSQLLTTVSDVADLERDIRDSVREPGWHYFGVSENSATHSGILAVDATSKQPRIYWLDQHSRGYRVEVTGNLDDTLSGISEVWHIMPNPLFNSDTGAGISLQTQGTGFLSRIAAKLGFNTGESNEDRPMADADGDGVPDKLQAGSLLSRLGKHGTFGDTDGDGVPDYRKIYSSIGRINRVPGDIDGDGIPDFPIRSSGNLPGRNVPRDFDGDGVPDVPPFGGADGNPNTPG